MFFFPRERVEFGHETRHKFGCHIKTFFNSVDISEALCEGRGREVRDEVGGGGGEGRRGER